MWSNSSIFFFPLWLVSSGSYLRCIFRRLISLERLTGGMVHQVSCSPKLNAKPNHCKVLSLENDSLESKTNWKCMLLIHQDMALGRTHLQVLARETRAALAPAHSESDSSAWFFSFPFNSVRTSHHLNKKVHFQGIESSSVHDRTRTFKKSSP